MSDKKYWQSFAELNGKPAPARNADEFNEELPFADLDDKGLDATHPRRDFLKYLGFSTAAASLAACEVPVRKAIPFVQRPENVVPGVAKYYASTYVSEGDAVPIVVKVRDGRPIKIEGNDLSTLTRGGTSARVQASVLDLYDLHRLKFPQQRQGADFREVARFEQIDTAIGNALARQAGKPVVVLTSTIVSPSTRQVINEFLGRYPGSRHVEYDAVSYSGLLLANGRRLPAYRFDKARVIVSLSADFLGTWLSPVEFARQYSYGRKINEDQVRMSRHYQFEPYLSMTGSSADERFVHRPSDTGAVALALYAALGGAATAPALGDARLQQGIQKAARDLQAARGAALVVSGSNDPNVQAVVAAINTALGAAGTTIESGTYLNARNGLDTEMVRLVNEMNAGTIGALLIADANPAYDFFDAEKFKAGMKKVPVTVSFNDRMDETTKLCAFSIPAPHFLESWGDAEPKTGYISFIQPTIAPLFKTRPFQTSLLKWSGNNTQWEDYFRNFWSTRLGSPEAFDGAMQDGILEGGARPRQASSMVINALADTSRQPTANSPQSAAAQQPAGATAQTPAQPEGNSGAVAAGGRQQAAGSAPIGAAAAVAALSAARRAASGKEVVLYQKVSMGSGKHAGNPWLLEVPDPVTKASWDNYALISTKTADELGVDYKDSDYEYYMDKPVIEFTANNRTIKLPVMVVPGMHPDTIAIAVGYGRNPEFSKAADGVGQNVFPFARFNGTTVEYSNAVTTSERSVGSHKIAQIQIHNSYEGRTEVVKETTMATFLKYPNEFLEERSELTKDYARKTGDYRKEATLYGDHVQPGPKWGMAIDMNSCIGCQACVVACHIENNVPVVGKSEVLRYHDMHWLRIDRYFVTEPENPGDLKTVVFQPMMCQHCDNAPCENVCPVAATPHSAEGINQMAYNRCIGTRYCANNCPYKVRRFNWADYQGADSFADNQDNTLVGKLDPVVHQMNDELSRMVLNPDVTVRTRGVMEKCSFCVQRVQEGKLKAKLENRALVDGDVESACAMACPTDAIVFGNANDPESRLTKMRTNNPQRAFYVLEMLHTLPNVTYLAKVRNTDELVERMETGGEHGGQSSEGDAPAQHRPAQSQH